MTSNQQTITGELRKWQRSKIGPDGKGTVIGLMYNDTKEIWEDGEAAVIHFNSWVVSVHFYLAVTNSTCIKCPKDEERPGVKGQRSSGAP